MSANKVDIRRVPTTPLDCVDPNNASSATVAVESSSGPSRNHLKRLLLDCMRKSSVRGLPRILNSRSICLRTLWTVAVLGFFIFLLYNIVSLSIVYRRGDVVMTWTQWTPRPPFPSVTVCDASPATRSALHTLPLTPRSYAQRIRELAAFERDANLTAYLEELLAPMAYHDQMDAEVLRAAAARDPLILTESCRVYYVSSDGVKRSRHCGRIEKIQVPGYFSCSNIDVSGEGEAYRLVLHILLDSDTDGLRCNRCIMDYAESLKIGAVVYLHESNVYPVDISDGLRLSPGTQSFIHVKVTQTVYQRDCLAAAPEPLDLYISGRQWRAKYATDLCTYLGRHDAYKEVCNCSMSCLPHTQPDEHTDDADYPSCLKQNLTSSPPRLDLTHITCLMQLDGKLLPAIASSRPSCEPLCTQVRFTVARSEAKGIDANSALDFFQRYVLNTSAHRLMQDRLGVYASALQLRSTGRDAEAVKLLANASYLEDNLISVVFQFNSHQAKKVTENYILGLSAFISQMGGLLSLFSGITVICIAELAELFWLMLRHLFCPGAAATDA